MIHHTDKSTFCPKDKFQKGAKAVPKLWNMSDWFVLLLSPVAVAIVLLAALFQVIEAYLDRTQDHFYLYYKL